MFSVFIIMNIRYGWVIYDLNYSKKKPGKDVIYYTIDDSETMPSMKGLGHKPDG